MSIDKLKTKFITGAFINDVKHYFSKINEIIDWINNIGTPSYKVYTALLTQSGTDAPVAIVLQNTLGSSILWTYDAVGNYRFELGNIVLPDLNKVFVNINNTYGEGYSIAAFSDSGLQNRISVYVTNSSNVAANSVLSNTSIEIRVYN